MAFWARRIARNPLAMTTSDIDLGATVCQLLAEVHLHPLARRPEGFYAIASRMLLFVILVGVAPLVCQVDCLLLSEVALS